MDVLDVLEEVEYDSKITKIEVHSYDPLTSSFSQNDEIRLVVQNQDLYTLPSESSLYIEGKVAAKLAAQDTIRLCNNYAAFLFEEIRYELNGVVVDICKNVGITSTLKYLVATSPNEEISLVNAGWDRNYATTHIGNGSTFNVCIPLKRLLGFCEDYKKLVINAKHELVLIRSRSDWNSLKVANDTSEGSITIEKIKWRMPHVSLNEIHKLKLLRVLDSGTMIQMPFRSAALYEMPLVQQTDKHTWAIKTSTQLEKPRFIIFALQTDKKNNKITDPTMFDHNKLSNFKLYLNSEMYPYENLNADFDNKRYAVLYGMYSAFQKSYYDKEPEPIYNPEKFAARGPLVVIDCSRQNEAVKSATVDIRIDFDCLAKLPDKTTAYCLILHDKIVEYSPLTNIVRALV